MTVFTLADYIEAVIMSLLYKRRKTIRFREIRIKRQTKIFQCFHINIMNFHLKNPFRQAFIEYK